LKKPLKGLVIIIYSLHCTLLHQLDRFMIPLQGSIRNVKKTLKGLVRIIYSLHCTLLHQLDRFMIPLQGSIRNDKVI